MGGNTQAESHKISPRGDQKIASSASLPRRPARTRTALNSSAGSDRRVNHSEPIKKAITPLTAIEEILSGFPDLIVAEQRLSEFVVAGRAACVRPAPARAGRRRLSEAASITRRRTGHKCAINYHAEHLIP
ncbi:hypothetical protein EVAR_86768_1 [Eumeta japonica]|uniref:Uncharacterized protein n=1 Tax=Eumeta variegata TaxID=151549 RepID=A0A4C1W2X1_EUMVA|nr:hypothetical protein EVAR_86768_1 [Eumeta japonica]